MAAFQLVKMINKSVSSFSYNGEDVPIKDGVVEVPVGLVDEFKSHGFALLEDVKKK